MTNKIKKQSDVLSRFRKAVKEFDKYKEQLSKDKLCSKQLDQFLKTIEDLDKDIEKSENLSKDRPNKEQLANYVEHMAKEFEEGRIVFYPPLSKYSTKL